MSTPIVDPERLEEQWSLNLEVLDGLAESGDKAEIPREIDVSFRGSLQQLERLSAFAGNFGFRVQSLEADEAGNPWLFLSRNQAADSESIRQLTITYLKIESLFDVECDGWGCVAQTGTTGQ